MQAGTAPVPLYPPALSNDDVAPLSGLSHRENHSGGCNPLERNSSNRAFPMKINLVKFSPHIKIKTGYAILWFEREPDQFMPGSPSPFYKNH
jgi:hypothetical protein